VFQPNILSPNQPQSSTAEANGRIHDDHEIHMDLFDDSVIGGPWTSLPDTSSAHVDDCFNVSGSLHPLTGHWMGNVKTRVCIFVHEWRNIANSNGSRFATTGKFGHELSFPMQTHEATFMQGQPDGTNVWDETELATTFRPHNGQASAPVCVPNAGP
jgi:hypothetical protein